MIETFDACSVLFEAANGRELIDWMSTSAILPDICIWDISMPVLNGYDTLMAVRKRWPLQKVIVLSAVQEPYVLRYMLYHGANSILLKTAIPAELYTAIRQVSSEGHYLPELLSPRKLQMLRQMPVPAISKRQREFLSLCGSDMNYKDIARTMGVSTRAIESLHQRLSDKLKINSRAGLATFAVKIGLIVLEDLVNASIWEGISMTELFL